MSAKLSIKPFQRSFIYASALALLVTLVACMHQVNTYPSLANQGILPLSTTNSFVGANLFLATEFQKSPLLYNFLKARGAPQAIEILEEGFSSTRILLFYPKEREVYKADLQVHESVKNREWIIRGPYSMQRRDFKSMAGSEAAMIGEPLFDISGKPFRFRFQKEDNKVVVVTPTPLPSRNIQKKRAPIVRKAAAAPTPVPAQATVEAKPETNPQTEPAMPAGGMPNFDQIAIQMARGTAPKAENGDVLHAVRGAGENLSDLSKWYAGSPDTQAEVAGYNKLSVDQALTPGQIIRIPAALVKQTRAMPAAGK